MSGLRQVIERVVAQGIETVLDKKLPVAVERVARATLEQRPDETLTEAGFHYAFFLALRDLWPTMKQAEASVILADYLDGARIGDPGYVWTGKAARQLAIDYANEFGEAP